MAVISQPTTASLATRLAERFRDSGHQSEVVAIPDREAAKTLTVVGDVAGELNRLGLTRHDLVVGVGGGAATDLAGFVAAVYLRGVDCVLVPTTLLAAVDAAIGGKTAVNVGGKNLVGAFRHPRVVMIDTDIIGGLPVDLLREGAAEALKTGFIADPALVDLYEKSGLDADVTEVVRRAVAVKARVVSADFAEHGERAILNYGHTIGHAIEAALGWPHGHAVATGMIAAAAASERAVGFADRERHDAVIAHLGLPTTVPGGDADMLWRYVALDKKRDGTGVRMVLLTGFGSPTVTHVDDATVGAAMTAVGVV